MKLGHEIAQGSPKTNNTPKTSGKRPEKQNCVWERAFVPFLSGKTAKEMALNNGLRSASKLFTASESLLSKSDAVDGCVNYEVLDKLHVVVSCKDERNNQSCLVTVNRGIHSTGVKRMGGGHAHGHDEPFYLHAKHMYNLDRMKYQKIKMPIAVFTAFSIGVLVPIYAVIFQQKKTASG
ncbi:hypothetical protein POTOM_058416 [Populus tomentosa]|uniref:Uncharacterized protein n=4 Tax=Saliceae TaxID=238069 RepID=A0A8X7XV61_POPTO|nr:hypothetical protein POTOM_058416 [Populus tomentosa]